MRLRGLVLAAAVAVVALVVPAVARADEVFHWNSIAEDETVLLRPTAHGQARGMAMVAGAMYDAVNAIERSHQPYLVDFDEVAAPASASVDAAAATAAYRVLLAITPDGRHAGLDAAYGGTLALIPDGPDEQAGVDAGEAAAAAMLAFRQGDGFLVNFTPSIGSGAGDWRPLGWPLMPAFDPDSWVANAKPFFLESPSQFRGDGPNPLASGAYAEEFNEVKELGELHSSTRTPDQTAAAVFWQFAPIRLWNRLSRDLAGRFGLDGADQARLYAEVNLAAADAATVCWNNKYYFKFWRPMAAIREADTDGNPATIAEPNWEPLFSSATPTLPALVTPPFPDYPSGHGCLSGAVLDAMADFFGTDKPEGGLTVVSDRTLSGVTIAPRKFARFSQVRKEIIDARVWGGIHFRTADVHGTVIGKKVAYWLEKHYFQPLD
jgi:hypothetical protein